MEQLTAKQIYNRAYHAANKDKINERHKLYPNYYNKAKYAAKSEAKKEQKRREYLEFCVEELLILY